MLNNVILILMARPLSITVEVNVLNASTTLTISTRFPKYVCILVQYASWIDSTQELLLIYVYRSIIDFRAVQYIVSPV